LTPDSSLLSLDIENFRNIECARLLFSPSVNFISGANAAGKTSLLEAIYCLGRVRSFRTLDANHLVRNGFSTYRLIGRIGLEGGRTIPIGMERHQGNYRVHLEGRTVHRLSDLAGRLPVQILTGDTTNILTGGPVYRRHFLDWALFHVEPQYRGQWQCYTRALRQRNAALKSRVPAPQVSTWDGELTLAARELDRLRSAYLADLEPYVQRELETLLPGRSMSLRYHSGWTRDMEFEAVLRRNLTKDQARGCTQSGPHRADIAIMADGRPVQATFSRGQQKTLVVAFLLGQAKLQQAVNAPRGAFLLDDLGSELDADHQARILGCLREIGSQVFVTAIEFHTPDLAGWSLEKRFHVEHGAVREML
jgi:DNA replication and repair protein RecF